MNEITISEKVTDILYNAIKKTTAFENIETLIGYASTFVFVTSVLSALTLNKVNNIFERNHSNIYDPDIELSRINNKLDKIIETNEEIILFINNYSNLKTIENKTETNIDEIEPNVVRKKSIIDDEEVMNECYDNIPCNNLKKVSNRINLFPWK